MSSRPVLESRAADKAQLATLEREHRRRPRPPIDHSEFADDCTGAKYGQDPVLAQQRGYDDLSRPFSSDSNRRQVHRRQKALFQLRAGAVLRRQKALLQLRAEAVLRRQEAEPTGGEYKLARSSTTNFLRCELIASVIPFLPLLTG